MPIRGEREVAKDSPCWAKSLPTAAGNLIQNISVPPRRFPRGSRTTVATASPVRPRIDGLVRN